jgi:hypothetical protein
VSVIRRWSSFRRLRLHRPTASDIKNSIQPTTPSFIRGFCPLATHTHTYTPVAVMEEKKQFTNLNQSTSPKTPCSRHHPLFIFARSALRFPPPNVSKNVTGSIIFLNSKLTAC